MSPPRKETQPRLFTPTVQALLSLPFRICNPPPAVGKVRSCGVTPLVSIKLQDVLDRKHLPPLGLKDFEEWLLYVEKCPGYLYFVLWLSEYAEKYHSWAADVKEQRALAERFQVSCTMPSSVHLAMFYARAKQTFFMPNSSYELDLPSDILASFHSPEASQLPDPILFNEISLEVHQRLEKCLERFVQAQLTNVGTNRVLCGMIAGCLFALIGAVPPLAINFATGAARWMRLAAIPGLWVGLSILFAALNGICLGVYIFGDLRQLHKFELSRPPISKPQHLRKERLSISLPLTSSPPPLVQPVSSPVPTVRPSPPKLTIVPPSPAHVATDSGLSRPPSRSSQGSYDSSFGASVTSSDSGEVRIEISGALYDEDVIDGPATSPLTPTMNYQFPVRTRDIEIKDVYFTNTAGFIHPYEDSTYDLRSTYDVEDQKLSPEERQPLSTFDFDALPDSIITPGTPVRNHFQHRVPPPTSISSKHPQRRLVPASKEILELQSQPPPISFSFSSIIARIQYHCNPRKWFLVSSDIAEKASPTDSPRSSFGHSGHNRPISRQPAQPREDDARRIKRIHSDEAAVQKQLRRIQAVPAFSALTRILSPVVVRAHWEIVTRSAIYALVVAWVFVGSLLAVPPRR